MSRPRREWWSFLCSRRCSVSSLMRAVSRATWTSGDPVSLSPRPYFRMTSCFASLVSGTRENVAERLGRASRRQAAHVVDVLLHLLLERLGGVEAFLVAQAVEQHQAQGLPVEVAVR